MKLLNEEKYFSKRLEILKFIVENIDKDIEWATYLSILILKDICIKEYTKNTPHYIATDESEVFSKFDIYNEGYDPYIEITKLLQKYSFLEGNCCEIGAGSYPRLAELVIPEIKLNHGSLTIYEPEIVFSDIENITVVKEKFTKDTDIKMFDTLYGLYPCDVTIPILDKAFEEDKNLMLAFCPCNHSTKELQKWIGKYWAEDVCMDYREKYGKEAEIINWPSYTGIDLPIMIRKSSKYKAKKR